MDPDAAWTNAVAGARRVVETADLDSNDDEHEAAIECAEAVLALDEWIAKGGFVPAVFRPAETNARLAAAEMVVAVARDALLDTATNFTCSEAEVMAGFLRAFADEATADAFMVEHASGDEQDDDHWAGS